MDFLGDLVGEVLGDVVADKARKGPMPAEPLALALHDLTRSA